MTGGHDQDGEGGPLAVVVLDLPPVRGRHHNRALAKARQNRCVQLAAQGWTYEAIKDELGYASRSTAWRHVQQALAEQQSESTVELRDLAAGRLDALLSACWAQAMDGDVAAIRSCLSVVLAQVKLHDLGPRLVRCTQPQTVVLFEDDCRLRGCPEHA